jgi:hypothetical protein
MSTSNFRFSLDLHSLQSQVTIPAFHGDTSKTLYITITDGGKPYYLAPGCLAKITIKRPTGTYLEDFCMIKDNNTVVYPFSQNEATCAVEGLNECDITLFSPEGGQLGTPRFAIMVAEKVMKRDDINITDEDYTVVAAMAKAEAERQAAEASRVSAEEERVSAEADRAGVIADLFKRVEGLEAPTFDLIALGLGTVGMGRTSSVSCDTTEIRAALDKGPVQFKIKLGNLNDDGEYEATILMGSIETSANMFTCCCRVSGNIKIYSDVAVEDVAELLIVVTDAHIWGCMLNLFHMPPVTAKDNGKLLQVVNGAWAAVSLTDVSTEGA